MDIEILKSPVAELSHKTEGKKVEALGDKGAKEGAKKIVILGDFNPQYYTHLAVNEAIIHLSNAVEQEVIFEWVGTDEFNVEEDFLKNYSGLWVASGSPYKDMDNVLKAIQYARENNIPTFGNCGGFQHMLIEYARNVCGLLHADTEETNPESDELIISKLTCSLVGQEEEISVLTPSLLHSLIGKNNHKGKYHCNYALNPAYIPLLESKGIKMTATNTTGEIRAFEIPDHPFFIGTLFQPALTSTADEPNPILMGFVRDVREVREVIEVRDVREARDVREVREVRDVRDGHFDSAQ